MHHYLFLRGVSWLSLVLIFFPGCAYLSLQRVEDTERGAPARLYISSPVVDLGEAISGTAVRKDIHLRNIGGSPLRIADTETSCGCTVVALDQQVVPPGGLVTMEVLVDTSGKMGPVEKTVTIRSNDAVQPELVLKLKVHVRSVAHGNTKVESSSIFQGDCRRCHVDPGGGLSGQRLFEADCSMCHRSKDQEYSPGPPVEVLMLISPEATEQGIRSGVEGTSMPGFARSEGGPLSETQIHSLIEYLSGPTR